MSWWDVVHMGLLAGQCWFLIKAVTLARDADKDRKEIREILNKLKAQVNYGRVMSKVIRNLSE
jgi:hypothetical protein